jgi:serine/threonine-protein kinase
MLGPVRDDDEITEPHRPVPADTQAHEVVDSPPGAPPPQDPGVPPRLARDMWPWLAALGVLAVAAVAVWLVVLNRNSSKGQLVPAVVGLQQQQAIARLTGVGFNVRGTVGPGSKPRGIVVSQTPGGGSRLDKGQTVSIAVSNGQPLGAVTTSARSATATTTTTQSTTAATTTGATTTSGNTTAQVPDVTGEEAASGAGQVEASGFVAQTDPVSATAPAGSITQENPAAGSQAAVGGVVFLSVAVGTSRPAQQVPDVVGRRAGAARAALLASKLTVKTEYRHGPAGKVGVVLSQTPAGGGSAPTYTQVAIVVGN